MPSDKTLSPETRAVKLAAKDLGAFRDSFRNQGSLFMQARRSPSTERLRAAVLASPAARDLMANGHPLTLAARVARIEARERRDNPLAALLAEHPEEV
ncbi:MAG: hypothetical protein FJ029_16425 [Actinobacteria bacterium]|nr:hypothetical protein [Actinomycetota bacterium]